MSLPAFVWIVACTGAVATTDSGKPGTPVDSDTNVAPETGETGTDSETGDSYPDVQCDRTRPWSYVAAGRGQTCGIHDDGCAECWGAGEDDIPYHYDWRGEDRPPEGDYESIHMFRYAEVGYGMHNCGILIDGSAVCFGDDEWGEGDLPAGDYADIAVTSYKIIGLLQDGSLVSGWPSLVLPQAMDYAQVEADEHFLTLLAVDGSVSRFDWDFNLLETVPGPYAKVARFPESSGACGLTEAGAVDCWDDADSPYRFLEDLEANTPPEEFTDVCIYVWEFNACGLAAGGEIDCWSGTDTNHLVVSAPDGTGFIQLACGVTHTCALSAGGEITCWGDDLYGETVPPT